MIKFKLNRTFRRKYDAIFKKDPLTANTLLLLFELADSEGRVSIPEPLSENFLRLIEERFDDPTEYQL